MRSSNKRSRGKSNRNRSPGNIINRVFDSSGPEGKVRGTPQQIIDKYTQLARDASLSNDRVAAVNFQQHAEHYTRLLAEATREAEARRLQADQQNRERQQREREQRDQREAARVDEGSADGGAEIVDRQGGDSGLVETPESKPKKRQSKPRKPKAHKADPAPEMDKPEAPEAAE